MSRPQSASVENPASGLGPGERDRPPLREAPASFALAAISGFVDTAGFILLDGIFTAHVTGNLVLAGAALAGTLGGSVWIRLALLGVFMIAVAASSLLARWAASRARPSIVPLLVAEAAFLGVFLASGLRWYRAEGPMADIPLFGVSSAAVVAMGIQNALMREGLKSFLPTTMMTGNMTQLTLDLVALGRGSAPPEAGPRLRRTANVVGGFVCGAAAGALGAATAGIASAAIPMVAVAAIAWCARPNRNTFGRPGGGLHARGVGT